MGTGMQTDAERIRLDEAGAGLGTISEILAGDPPHLPNGCSAQAWSVAEVLRVWRTLDPPALPADS
jgi:hypothetical protein